MEKLDRYVSKEIPTSTKFNKMVDAVNELMVNEASSLPSTLVDNTTYVGSFTLSGALALPASTKYGIVINKATIAAGFAFSGDYVGDVPVEGKTYVVSVLDGVWSFNEVKTNE